MAEAGRVERIRARLQAALAPAELRIDDDSAAHASHAGARGGAGHYRVYVVSERFRGLPRLARHRLVYDALHDLIPHEIHALSMTLLAPEEVGGVKASPRKS
ncbi:MAG: BolA family protein [Sutterellaceae bacterium]|nr:BolA family transcriptional regulator [Burkholderiaceae bacterium]MCX7901312.1 BolA family transcriptional regulator [Burkholderiaceae bacterium]MDW8429492.1 BolA family protein [Sutterellaceae bacterium]